MNISHLMFAAAVMMGATVVAVAVPKKLGLGSHGDAGESGGRL